MCVVSLSIGGCDPVMVHADVEFNVHNAQGKILGTIRAKSERDGLNRAKRSVKKFPNANFLTRYATPTN